LAFLLRRRLCSDRFDRIAGQLLCARPKIVARGLYSQDQYFDLRVALQATLIN
jgi:hypothetical protein